MAGQDTSVSSETQKPPLIPDHMAGWSNDDLLLQPAARAQVEAEHKGACRVFVWESLSDLFKTFDSEAGKKRRLRQKSGLIAVLLTTIGSAISAALPLFGGSGALFVISAALSVFGLVWCLALAISDPNKADWLQNRLRTERLRQFYFQFMGSDPALAAAAFSDDAALERWKIKRQQAEDMFRAWLAKDMRQELDSVVRDVNHREAWQMTSWENPPATPARTPALDDYFALMRKQRIGIQGRYITQKLRHGFGSPLTRHMTNQVLSYIVAIVTIGLSVWTAMLVVAGTPAEQAPIPQIVSAMALLGVLAMFLKIMAEGQQLRADVDRYQWYKQAIDDVDARFNDPDPAARIAALRKMEENSYRELRDFLKAHNDARFSFG